MNLACAVRRGRVDNTSTEGSIDDDQRPRDGRTRAKRVAASRSDSPRRGLACASRPALRPVRFDWGDEETHDAALDGVERVYLVPPSHVPDPALAMRRFVDRALAGGVTRIYCSARPPSPRGPGVGGSPTCASGCPSGRSASVVVHQYFVTPNIITRAASRPRRDYTATGDGDLSRYAGDIAEVALRALLDEPHDAEHVITGPRPLTYDEVAAAIGEAAGRPVRQD